MSVAGGGRAAETLRCGSPAAPTVRRMVPPLQSYFLRVRGDRVVVENLGNHEWVELGDLDEVAPQIERWLYASGRGPATPAGSQDRSGAAPVRAAARARTSPRPAPRRAAQRARRTRTSP